MYTGIHLKQEQDFGFSIPARSRTRFRAIFPVRTELVKKMEQDFERIHGSKSRISQILFLFGGIPVYIRTGLNFRLFCEQIKLNYKFQKSVHAKRENAKHFVIIGWTTLSMCGADYNIFPLHPKRIIRVTNFKYRKYQVSEEEV